MIRFYLKTSPPRYDVENDEFRTPRMPGVGI